MPTSELRFRRSLRYGSLGFALLGALMACSNSESPPTPPAGLQIVSGDAQYTKKGTRLEDPIAVRVTDDKGAPLAHMSVHFQVVEGGGTLSHPAATTNNDGRASVKWTVGSNTGLNRMRITVAENSSLGATATATSAEFYCPEEDPAFTAKFTGAGDVMMLTHSSSLASDAGLIHYDINGAATTFVGNTLQSFADQSGQVTVRDCVFSANGDLYLSWINGPNEVVKVATNGTVTHFATLDPPPVGSFNQGAELSLTPNGVLVGCDVIGPFYVTCRDSLFRFNDAIFSGLDRDAANNDAVACDPNSGDVYFIYLADRDLFRIPFDGTTSGTKVKVADLPTVDVSDGAKGMVVDGNDGSIYILVDYSGTTTTKEILKVTSAGVVTTAFDFTTRADAGIQSDLALDRTTRNLYTLDTKNNVFLAFGLPGSGNAGSLITLTPGAGALEASNSGSGERVGLDIIPAAGP